MEASFLEQSRASAGGLPASGHGSQSAPSVATSSGLWTRRDETLLIFDFDDTLYPTKWMMANIPQSRRMEPLDGVDLSKVHAVMPDVVHQVKTLFVIAQSIAHVVIITNAQRGWVDYCLETYAPEMQAIFEGVDIVYAREALEASGREVTEETRDPDGGKDRFVTTARKVEAMRTALHSFYKDKSWKNVVSIGDSFDELEALEEVTFLHDNPTSRATGTQRPLRTKAIKMLDRPTIQELIAQIAVVRHVLYDVVNFDGDFQTHLVLNPQASQECLMDEMKIDVWAANPIWSAALKLALGDPETLLTDKVCKELGALAFGDRITSANDLSMNCLPASSKMIGDPMLDALREESAEDEWSMDHPESDSDA
mmetsp:Transcript_24088/g.54911  ORF Transcript_24088/g.54911 Transcript_24088/m.54911 type:complete len:368 (-) Transcript_24088:292-1395(-)